MSDDPDAYDSAYHRPVLLDETLAYLAPKPGEIMFDATLGGGGHSAALLAAIRPGGVLIGLDQDQDALDAARTRFGNLENRDESASIILLHTPFGKLEAALMANSVTQNVRLDGALFDLGVSSHQLDAARGFSFRRDEPLNMRMDAAPDAGPTVADLLRTESETEIARFLWEYGEERWSRRIAQRIVAQRQREPIVTTGQLTALVEAAIPRGAWPRDIHVATRTFQGLRIAVNDELGQLRDGLEAALNRMKPGARLVVISYHSLEDRIVKQLFASHAGRSPSAPGMSPAAFLPPAPSLEPPVSILTRKPIAPTEAEVARNPRARSAKLRAVEVK